MMRSSAWLALLACSVEIASEYRYRAAVANPKQLVVTISQSGETLDTMEALKYAKALGHERTLSICNVQESAIPRASELVCYTRAGAEIGVASTKAFTTQLVALMLLVLAVRAPVQRLFGARVAYALWALPAQWLVWARCRAHLASMDRCHGF